MSLRFEWNGRKALTNQGKHGVSFEEVMSVFAAPLDRIFSARKTTKWERQDYEERCKS